jgi:2-dehydropantoate 2-reductase
VRYIVYGAGAIGATLGARLHQSGQEVVLIARGAQAAALRDGGLTFESHDATLQLRLPVVERPSELRFGPDDIVLLAMKTQHTTAALAALAETAPAELPIACAQNGVENERLALRSFERVLGISVMCPALYLRPGHVQAFGTPLTGALDLGVYPRGSDALCQQLSAAFRAARFASQVQPQILRFKYGKLLFNLGNAIEAVCGPAARKGPIADLVRREAIAALTAAGVEFDAELAAQRAESVKPEPLGASARPGGSSWQSLTRRTGNIETDYLNGEIVLLGRSAGVATPANALLQRLSNELARTGAAPGALTPEEFLLRLPST